MGRAFQGFGLLQFRMDGLVRCGTEGPELLRGVVLGVFAVLLVTREGPETVM